MPKLNSDSSERRKLVVEEVSETPIKEVPAPVSNPEPIVETTVEVTVEKKSEVPDENVTPMTPPLASSFPTSSAVSQDDINTNVGPNPAFIIIPGILLLGALLGGIVFYQKSVNTDPSTNITSPEPTVTTQSTTQASATPAATVDKNAHKIAIQNGSGVKGEAAKVQTIIENADFTVSTTGNADSYDYTETVIKAKSTVEESFVSELSKVLAETYKVATKIQTLSSSSKDDVVVIVGTSKN